MNAPQVPIAAPQVCTAAANMLLVFQVIFHAFRLLTA